MKIKKIKIENYKSIVNPICIDNLSNLSILVGPNNAGKTNILDAIEVLFNSDKKDLRRDNSKINLSLEFHKNKTEISYFEGEPTHSLSSEKYSKLKNKVIRIDESISLEEIATTKLKNFKKNHSKEYKKFSELLENYFQEVHISEELFKSNVETSEGKKPLKRMGEGFKRLFVILFYLYNPNYKLLLIDEPELHLHPSIIKKLLKILNKKDFDNQVILTTHHPTLVQAKLFTKIWRVTRDATHSTSVHKFNKESVANIDRFIQEINDDNSAMFFADKVLLVEGVSDSILMRWLIDKFYKGKKDIKVVYTGGMGDMDLYERICKIFNISYKAMIDGDALDSYWNKKNKQPMIAKKTKREAFKDQNIFVLKGCLEDNYPRKYQKRETKPLNALLASSQITEQDFNSKKMSGLREVVNNI